MKCPKCGFNSFEFLDNCKKCGNSLASFKKSLGINPIVYAQGGPQTSTYQKPAAAVTREEAPIATAPPALSDEDAANSFTWDIPALSETSSEADGGFSGFDLDFMKEKAKPDEAETGFVFSEEPTVESPALAVEETAITSEEFSFYEETLDLAEKSVFSGSEEASLESENDPFGETGIMGEIPPEKLQSTYQEPELPGRDSGVPLEQQSYENEFVLEELVEEEEEVSSIKEVNDDPVSFSDFEKEFESIFQTDEPSDDNKAAN